MQTQTIHTNMLSLCFLFINYHSGTDLSAICFILMWNSCVNYAAVMLGTGAHSIDHFHIFFFLLEMQPMLAIKIQLY